MGRVATGTASGVKSSQMFSMCVVSDFIPDRSRPGIITTVTSDWAPKATGGHATWMQRRGGKQWRRKKERNKERKKAKKIKLKIATLNVGTMTRKGREVADLMERRGVDILCVQETHWKGEKARCIDGGYILWLWKRKQKEWRGNHIEKGACGQDNGVVESNRQDNRLEDGS